MSNSLFLFEMFVNRIMFDGEMKPFETKEDISFSFKFSNVFNIFIEPKEYKNKQGLTSLDTETIYWYNMGVTHVFVNSPQYLKAQLEKHSIECTLNYKNRSVGKFETPWKHDFIEMVSLLERVGVVKAVDNTDFVTFLDSKQKKVATLVVFFRLTCPGDCVESEVITDVEVTTDKRMHVAIFLYLKTSKNVLCKGYDYMSTDFSPVALLYKPVLWFMPADFYPGADYVSPMMMTVPQDDAPNMIELFDQVTSFDTVSIALNPDTEHKFYEFLNVNATATTGKGWSVSQTNFETVDVETLDVVAKKMCKKYDCPGCKKFAQLGIDLFNLKPVVDGLEPEGRCMIVHANGNVEGYGPSGYYRRPKSVELPFVPLSTLDEEKTVSVTNACCNVPKDKEKSRKSHKRTKLRVESGCPKETRSK